jgi:sulfotransferase family protein
MKIVCLWSGPRNVSTALMYSFARRPDTRVVDEPLYGHYLRVSGADHPGRDQVMQAMNCDGDAVMLDLLSSEKRHEEVLFIKHMAHHLVDLDQSFLRSTQNVFLIRDPVEMLPSLTVQIPTAGLADTGLKRQWEIYQDLRARQQSPAIIDSRQLLLDPAGVIAALCQHLDLEFVPGMLSWPAGPIKEDGVWARHWYHNVHKSTGFANYVAKDDFPAHLRPLLEQCRPYYENLYACSIGAHPSTDVKP